MHRDEPETKTSRPAAPAGPRAPAARALVALALLALFALGCDVQTECESEVGATTSVCACAPGARRTAASGWRCVPLDGGLADGGACGACGAPAPHCAESSGRCVECLEPSHCTAPRSRCDIERGRCVECTADAECASSAPRCDPSDGACVACIDASDCLSPSRICTAERVCVECETDSDCALPEASACVAGACVPCESSADCAHIAGRTACATTGSLAGTCVECTESESGACSTGVCSVPDHVCSEYGSDQALCEPCDTDANCASATARCIATRFMGGAVDFWYCLEETTTGSCTGRRPYSTVLADRVSRSGHPAADYCGTMDRVTCPAVLAFGRSCESLPCPAGGRCRPYGPAGADVCVYACDWNEECPAGDSNRCVGDAMLLETSCREL